MGINPGGLFTGGIRDDIVLLELTRRAIADWERQAVKSQSGADAARGRRLLQDLRERRMSLADPWKRANKMTVDEIKTADKLVFEIDDLLGPFSEKIAAATEVARIARDEHPADSGSDRRGGTPMRAHNQDDAQGTFKGRKIGNIYDGMGAAGRALLDDVKAATAPPTEQRLQAAELGKAAQAYRTIARLNESLAGTMDPARRTEIKELIDKLTRKFNPAAANKVAGADVTKAVWPDAVKALGEWTLQAEQLVFELDNLIEQTVEAPLREALGFFAGKIRQEYNITSVRPPRLEREAVAAVRDKREQTSAAIGQLEFWRDKTDDPTLRKQLDRMAGALRRTYGILGPVAAPAEGQPGQRYTLAPLPPAWPRNVS